MYTQTTPDTCLPSSLMMLLDIWGIIEPSQDLEIEILVEGGRIGKENRGFAHLLYVCKKFRIDGTYYSNDDEVLRATEKIRRSEDMLNVKICRSEIDSVKIKELIKIGPVIVCIDDYALRKDVHFPHYVVVESCNDEGFEVLDPWEGKRFELSNASIKDALSLLDELNYWREIIILENQLHEN